MKKSRSGSIISLTFLVSRYWVSKERDAYPNALKARHPNTITESFINWRGDSKNITETSVWKLGGKDEGTFEGLFGITVTGYPTEESQSELVSSF